MRPFILGTRGSSLALCQARIVQTRLEASLGDRPIRLQTIKAQADRHPDVPLVALGGEGIFVKELEEALLDGRIDAAVHSLKDLPLTLSARLRIAAVLEREEPRDALVSRLNRPFDELAAGARLGTSSVRRQSQLLHRRRDLSLLEIRGNVDTRLRKLDEGRYDAIVLAACGLIRLGLEERITEYLDVSWMLPEPGQGALAIEARADDEETMRLLGLLEDPVSRACVEAERAFLLALGGGCRVPMAAYASCAAGTLDLEGVVLSADGREQIRDRMSGPMTEPMTLGHRLAQRLESLGARSLLTRSP